MALAVALFIASSNVTDRFSNPAASETSIGPAGSDTKPAITMCAINKTSL